MRVAAYLSLLFTLGGCATAPPRCHNHCRDQISRLVHEAAGRHRVEESLILGVIKVESSFNPSARSHVGAGGLMQLMPRTAASLARRLGYDDYEITDPRFNIDAGTYYLAYLLRIFGGERHLALAAYNTGPARVRRWQARGRPLPAYSRRYVAAVEKARGHFRRRPDMAPPRPPRQTHDRAGLRQLLRKQLYGERADEPIAARNPRPKK